MQLIYVTSNLDKFNKAKVNLQHYGINLVQKNIDMLELQTHDGQEIAQHKAEQAYEIFKQPLIVNDDSWSIPALRGFPAANMKLCNHFLKAEDWMRLMKGQTDKRVFLISHYAFHNGKTIQHIKEQTERYF